MSDVRATAKEFISRVERQEFLRAFDMVADDGRYILIGTTAASRIYNDKRDLFENLMPLLSTFKEPPILKFEKPIVDGDRAVLVASGKGVGPKGPYDQPYYAFVMRVRGGQFSEIIEFADTVMVETAIFGRKVVAA